MNNVIQVTQAGYTRYEQLLMQRDQFRKQTGIYSSLYMKEFGDDIQQAFACKIECIRLRKSIGLYQAALNYGKKINAAELEARLQVEMQAYYQQLQEIAEANEGSKHLQTISEYNARQIKKLYHELAKLIHPDLHPQTEASAGLSDLWHRISAAYRANDLEELENLKVLVDIALKNSANREPIAIPDIEERTQKLEKEIKSIVETDPYQYRYLLLDCEAVADKHAEYRNEIDEYTAAQTQLQALLDELMKKGELQWVMN